MTTIDTCPGCGYPKFGPGLCAYCLPDQAIAQRSDSVVDAAPRLSRVRQAKGRQETVPLTGSPPASKAG